jgi:hypothetical protein
VVQQAFQSRLLCVDCERYFNEEFETPFHEIWYKRNTAPMVVFGPVYRLQLPDYVRFKLFFLSVLWRAAVCIAKPFANVNIGDSEPKLRRMLEMREAGPAGEFPIVGSVIHVPNSLQVSHVAASPFSTKWPDCSAYVLTFGGCIWHVLLRTGQLPSYLQGWALQEDGRMALPVVDMSNISPLDNLFRDYVHLAVQKGWRMPLAQ